MRSFIRRFFLKLVRTASHHSLGEINSKLDRGLILSAQTFIKHFDFSQDIKSFTDVEFSVFSQWGDDGIIQYLIRKIDIPVKSFIEFGVENYKESNTRFLLLNDNWSGLIMDSSKKHLNFIRNDSIVWKHNLKAVRAFINAENINGVIKSAGYRGEIGSLSIDID